MVWSIETNSAGMHDTQTTYLTGGMSWQSDYIANVNQNDDKVDLTGWVTLNNNSGTYYPNSKLKLVAGEVNRVTAQKYGYDDLDYYEEEVRAAPSSGQFVEEGLFEYHLYTLQRKTNINNNETKQIQLLSVKDVPVEKILKYDWQRSNTKVQTFLNFLNSEEKGLGIPLPKGIVRAYKADTDGQSQFIGEDQIDHTPKDEEIEIFLGESFDITAERTIQESERKGSILDFGKSCTYQEIEVLLKNHKDEAISVIVVENLYGSNNDVIDTSIDPEKIDAFTYEFTVKVPKDGETKLSYTTKYCY